MIPRELFSLVVAFSEELELVNQIFYAGKELGGTTFASPVLIRLADAAGFKHWYETITTPSN